MHELRDHGRVAEVRVPRGEAAQPRVVVEIGLRARSPVEGDLPRRAALEDLAQDRLERRVARAPAHEQQGPVAAAVDELAERALDVQERARLHRAEHLATERAARRVPDVQLQESGIVRRVREREAAAALARQHHVDVLARLPPERLDGREP